MNSAGGYCYVIKQNAKIPITITYINKTDALLNVNSNMKNENTPTKEGGTYGYAEAEEHRYIYENYIRSSMKLLEEMSNSKQRTVLNNIKKLAKVSGELVTIDETDEGETVYKIYNKTSYNKETHKFNKYVLIPSDILKFLVKGTNSNVIKIYCILLYKNDVKKLMKMVRK